MCSQCHVSSFTIRPIGLYFSLIANAFVAVANPITHKYRRYSASFATTATAATTTTTAAAYTAYCDACVGCPVGGLANGLQERFATRADEFERHSELTIRQSNKLMVVVVVRCESGSDTSAYCLLIAKAALY
jgi:hypothetical protein